MCVAVVCVSVSGVFRIHIGCTYCNVRMCVFVETILFIFKDQFLTDRVRSTRGGYIFSLSVSSHLGKGGGGVPTFRAGGGTYFPRSGWGGGGGVPTFPGLGGGGGTYFSRSGYLPLVGTPPTQGRYPPPRVGTPPATQGRYPPTQGRYPPVQGRYPPHPG